VKGRPPVSVEAISSALNLVPIPRDRGGKRNPVRSPAAWLSSRPGAAAVLVTVRRSFVVGAATWRGAGRCRRGHRRPSGWAAGTSVRGWARPGSGRRPSGAGYRLNSRASIELTSPREGPPRRLAIPSTTATAGACSASSPDKIARWFSRPNSAGRTAQARFGPDPQIQADRAHVADHFVGGFLVHDQQCPLALRTRRVDQERFQRGLTRTRAQGR